MPEVGPFENGRANLERQTILSWSPHSRRQNARFSWAFVTRQRGDELASSEADSKAWTFRFLTLARALRSVGIGFSTIALPLYMAALGFSPVTIGLSFVLMTLAGTGLVFFWGVLGDRVGYKNVLIAVEVLFGGSCLILATNTSLVPVVIAAMMGGYGGQGGGGLRGSFGPGLSAFVGSVWKGSYERTRTIGTITFIGGIASLAGYAVLAWVGSRVPAVGDVRAYRDAYLLLMGTTAVAVAALLLTKEGLHPPRTAKILTKEGQKFMGKVVVSNVFNGLGLGLAIPLLPLWFSLRFGYGAGTIAVIFGASTALSSVASYFSHAVAVRLGSVKTAALTRAANGVLLVAMALAPLGLVAGAIYAARGISGGLGAPVRTSVTLGGVAGSEMGVATGISGVSMRASLVSSGAAGYLLAVAENAPLGIGGVLQIVGGALYYRLLRGTPASPEGPD